jgi:hypothetical protein
MVWIACSVYRVIAKSSEPRDAPVNWFAEIHQGIIAVFEHYED